MSDRFGAITAYAIDETGLLCATWVLAVTWGVAMMQVITYLQNRSKDSALLQGFVICLSLNETASTIIAFVAVHQQILLSVPGTLESLSLPKIWIVTSYLANITLFGVNIFFIYRYYLLTRRWWLSVPVALLACASLGIHAYANTLGIQVASNITKTSVDIVQLFNTVAETMRFSKIGSAIEFTVVALTYALMVIELTKYLRQDLRNGKRVIRKLVLATLESGIVTFVLVGILIGFSWSRPDPAPMGIVMLASARTYYHTLLFNLNMRNNGGVMMQGSNPSLSHITTSLPISDSGCLAPGTDVDSSGFRSGAHADIEQALKEKPTSFRAGSY